MTMIADSAGRGLGTDYDVVLVLHVLCAIVGFGAVLLNGVYGARIRGLMQSGRGAEGLAVYEANFKVSQIGQYFIYAVFVLGLALVGMSDDVWDFDHTLGVALERAVRGRVASPTGCWRRG